MNAKQLVISLISNAALIALATAFINYRYNRKLQSEQYAQLQRQKAEILAQLLAKWGKYRGGEGAVLNNKELYDYYEELNRMSYEAVLWIGDDSFIEEIETLLMTSGDVVPVLRRARKYILGTSNMSKPKDIAVWPGNETIEKRLFPHRFDGKTHKS